MAKRTTGGEWQDQGIILQRNSDPKAWDSVSLWTGYTLKHDGIYYLFYTARCQSDVAEDGYIGHTQRIGVATSTDLVNWTKHPANPILSCPGAPYETQQEAFNKHLGWRDPCIVADEKGGFYAFFTCRAQQGDPLKRGAIGRAYSQDLINWKVLPPAADPRRYTDMEVPDVIQHKGCWYMLFAVKETWHHPSGSHHDTPVTGVRYLVSDSLEGEFVLPAHDSALLTSDDALYTARFWRDENGQLTLWSWRAGADEGTQYAENAAAYTLAHPMKIETGENNQLLVVK
ncbi:glycoside hydrolase family 68 protein [Reinekea marinisedimentorum]